MLPYALPDALINTQTHTYVNHIRLPGALELPFLFWAERKVSFVPKCFGEKHSLG